MDPSPPETLVCPLSEAAGPKGLKQAVSICSTLSGLAAGVLDQGWILSSAGTNCPGEKPDLFTTIHIIEEGNSTEKT